MRYALGIVVFTALLLGILSLYGGVIWFFDMPTFLAFVIVIAAVLFITGEFKTFVKAVNCLLAKKYVISSADKEKAIRLFRLIGKTVVASTVFFVIAGLIATMGMLDDPAHFGPMIAVTLLSVLYAAFINMAFVYPAIHILKTRLNQEAPVVISEKQVVNKMLELCYRQGISPEDILEADEISFKKQ